MKFTVKAIWLVLVLMTISACAPDPRKEAKAQETIINAQQAALTAEQDRQIAREQADFANVQANYWQAQWDGAMETVQIGLRTVVFTVFIGMGVIVLGIAWTVKETSFGLGRTFVQFAEVRAGLIHMDKSTRTFPAFVDVRQIHGTRVVAMLASGGVLKLDTAQAADRQLIAALAQVSALGAFGQEMSGAQDAAGMATFQPDVISAHEGALTVGSEFIQMLKAEGVAR